jgi:iron uptake system component EfeO
VLLSYREVVVLSRRGTLQAAGAAVLLVAVGGTVVSLLPSGHPAAAAPEYPGLPLTTVQVSSGDCGSGWTSPRTGLQVFQMRNTSSSSAEVYLRNAATGAVLGEVESLAAGTASPMVVRLGSGTYQFSCLPDDADAVQGPEVKVSGPGGTGGPAVLPVTQQDLIAPTLAYQQWVAGQLPGLVSAVDTLRAAITRADLAAARAAWLPAHLRYERLGAAYGAFGDADQAINGTTAGLAGGLSDPAFTGFHRLEYGLWHGESAASLAGQAATLDSDVRGLWQSWSQVRMDPQVLGVRAHEIVENTIQFELTGRTDYGSGSNLATARANLDGTREALSVLQPVLSTRISDLPQITAALDAAQQQLDGLGDAATGRPLSGLTQPQRERLNAAFGDLVERLAEVAAVCDLRRVS